MKTQEELFDEIKYAATRTDSLKGFVQNDFERMILDGYLTKEELQRAVKDAEDQFNNVIGHLIVLRDEVMECIQHAAETI